MRNAMVFDPAKLKIEVDWEYLKGFQCWRRQAIALFAHEVIHIFEWVILCRFNVGKWNRMDCHRANKIQDSLLHLLRCKIKWEDR